MSKYGNEGRVSLAAIQSLQVVKRKTGTIQYSDKQRSGGVAWRTAVNSSDEATNHEQLRHAEPHTEHTDCRAEYRRDVRHQNRSLSAYARTHKHTHNIDIYNFSTFHNHLEEASSQGVQRPTLAMLLRLVTLTFDL